MRKTSKFCGNFSWLFWDLIISNKMCWLPFYPKSYADSILAFPCISSVQMRNMTCEVDVLSHLQHKPAILFLLATLRVFAF